MSEKYKDCIGNDIGKGDLIAYPVTFGNTPRMRVAKVLKLVTNMSMEVVEVEALSVQTDYFNENPYFRKVKLVAIDRHLKISAGDNQLLQQLERENV